MQITDTIKKFDLKDLDLDLDLDELNERFAELSRTATGNYAETSDRFIDALVDANKKLVELVVTNAERLPESPFADRMPTPAETGQRYLDLVERVADFNRDLNRRFVEMAPEAPAAKKPAAKKTTTKKATTRKTSAAK